MEREEFVSKVSEMSKLAKEVQTEIPDVIRIGLGPDGDFKVHLMPETFNEMFKEYYLSFKVGYTYSTVKKNRKFSVIK